uniref:E3 ubiquitin-protein ligase BRE1-like n=1 Tax=Saccoglossus kowalevskii TaxID=10224 RepID=A0ABM0M8L5_SACKO|nr:PREDICTED: E3 ubiquitin-protein ligase BRE1-like [Saccoglossus kowalevskii]
MHNDDDFKTFLKTSLCRLEKKMDKLNEEQRSITERFEIMEKKQEDFERSLNETSIEVSELKNNHMAVDGRLEQAEKQIEELESKLKESEEESLRITRYSRSFNLRFGGIETSTGENCIETLINLLKDKLGFEDPAAMIENVHRIYTGNRPASRVSKSPPHIIVKFLR